MNTQIKKCQNCKESFVIDASDFDFYKKVQVPPPTFCPECRFQRRLAFHNLTNLYHRPCDLCKKNVISMYAPETSYRIYCPPCWWSDNWDTFEYGREYDFSRPFFEQFNELLHEVPLLGLSLGLEAIGSPHNNHAGHLKNCYLLFQADFVEDSAYGVNVVHNKTVFDCSLVRLCEYCYDGLHVFKNNRGIGLYHTVESLDCMFLRDCVNCQNCFGSANLRNKKYHIFNKPYTKDEYFKTIKQWDLGSYKMYQEIKSKAKEHWEQFPPKPRWDEMSVDITGNYVFESKNCKQCFEVMGARDCKYIFMMTDGPIRDCYDISSWGDNQRLSYECNVVGENVSNVKFCQEAGINLYDTEYCKLSTGGSSHFGCVSVKKGMYCILNKKYTKQEYKKLISKIVQHMNDMPYKDKKGRMYKYGEFFPIELSPQYYNETIAQRFFPLSKKQVIDQGYDWKDLEAHKYETTLKADDIPDHIQDAKDTIVDEVIECKRCKRGFKVIQMEFAFLHKMNLPLPRQCPFCRINKKFDQWVKNLQIVTRACSQCNTEFETSYSKERAKTILCKACYLKEVV